MLIILFTDKNIGISTYSTGIKSIIFSKFQILSYVIIATNEYFIVIKNTRDKLSKKSPNLNFKIPRNARNFKFRQFETFYFFFMIRNSVIKKKDKINK